MSAITSAVIELVTYGKHGWEWTITQDGKKRVFRTNGQGCGLFRNGSPILAPDEFSLTGNVPEVYRAIVHMAEEGRVF